MRVLGRLSSALREQNWFAVVLEILILIVGVGLGFQVSEWGEAQDRSDRQAQVMASLREEFEAIREESLLSLGYHDRTIEGLRVVTAVLKRGSLGEEEEAEFRVGLNAGYTYSPPAEISSTWSEILANGELALIEDPELRSRLVRYDRHAEAAVEAFLHIRIAQEGYTDWFTAFVRLGEVGTLGCDDVGFSAANAWAWGCTQGSSALRERGARSLAPIDGWDMPEMLAEPRVLRDASQLLQLQVYYYNWHHDQLARAEQVLDALGVDLSAY